MDDTLVTWSVRIRAKRRLRDKRTRKTQREHVLCYLRVVRWLGQATPSCQVLLQWRRTRAGAQITLTGLPKLETGMDGQVILTGLSGLTVGSSNDRVIQGGLAGLATWIRNREAQAGLQTRNSTQLTRKTRLHSTQGGGAENRK
jgi:hypothetical protein